MTYPGMLSLVPTEGEPLKPRYVIPGADRGRTPKTQACYHWCRRGANP